MQVVLHRAEGKDKTASSLLPDLAEELDELRARLAGMAGRLDDGPPLEEARALLRRPGKLMRPLLVLTGARLGPTPPPERLALATAVELVHVGSLVHDDLIDESVTRRGLAAVHVRWGSRLAHLAGDWFFARAWASLAESLPATEIGMDLLRALGRCGDRLYRGQLLEWRLGDPPREIAPADWEELARLKTASLLSYAAWAGARLAGASAPACEALRRYGDTLGLAFQLADDLEEADEARPDLPRPRHPGLSTLEGRGAARERARAFAREARKALAPLPSDPVRQALEELSAFAVERVLSPEASEAQSEI